MKYIKKGQNNIINLKLNSGDINNFSGTYIFKFINIQTNDVVNLTLSDISTQSNLYQRFLITSGNTVYLEPGQHDVSIYDTGNTSVLIQEDKWTITDVQPSNKIYFMPSGNTKIIFNTTGYTNALPATPDFNLTLLSSGVDVQINLQLLSTNTNSFEIWRKQNISGTYQNIGDIQALIYFDNFLLYNSEYFYKVRAKNTVGFSSFTIEKSILTSSAVTGQTLSVYTKAEINAYTADTQNHLNIIDNEIQQLSAFTTGITTNFVSLIDYQNYTGTTAPNIYETKTAINFYTGTTAPNQFASKIHTHPYSGLTGLPDLSVYETSGDTIFLINNALLPYFTSAQTVNYITNQGFLTGVTANQITGITSSLYANIIHTHSYTGTSITDKPDLSIYETKSAINFYTGTTAPNTYLGINACANDSKCFNAKLPAYYLNTGSTALCATTAGNALCLNGHTEANLSVSNSACLGGSLACTYAPLANPIFTGLLCASCSCFSCNILIPNYNGYIGVGVYGTISETNSGDAYITGNNVRAGGGVNSIIKYANCSDPAQFMKMRYDMGISFHTGIGAGDAINTAYPDTVNQRMIIDLTGNVKFSGNTCSAGCSFASKFIESGTCLASKYLGINATASNALGLCGCTPACFLGATACATDSAKLNNKLPAYYLNTGSTALCATTAGNALCLGGYLPSHYSITGHTHATSEVIGLDTETTYLQTQINQLSQIQTATIFYFEHLSANVGTYERMTTTQLTTSGHSESTTGLNNNTVLIDEFITDTDIPSVTTIPSGLWTFHSHAQWSSVTGNNFLHWDVYKTDNTGGTLTFLFRTSTPDIGVTTLQEYQVSQIYSGTTMNATDRLVLRILAQTTGGAKTATLQYAGTNVFGFMQPPLLVNMSPQWASIQNKPIYLDYVSGLTSSAQIQINNKLNSSIFNTYTGDTYIITNPDNVYIGIGVGTHSVDVDAYFNVGVGAYALSANTYGIWNAAVGARALISNTDGTDNMAFGADALHENIDGSYNIAIGSQALQNSADGWENTAIGASSQYGRTTGDDNTSIGNQSLENNTNGYYNVAIGNCALCGSLTGSSNVVIGNRAGANELGSNKLYIANSNTVNPLIYGDFALNCVKINSCLNVATSITSPKFIESGTCLANTYLGINACANDSKCFNAKLPAYYLNTGSTALCATTAGNALALCGCVPSCFLGATATACCATTAGNALALCGCTPACFLGATATACCAATAGNALCLNGHTEANLSVSNSACLGGSLACNYAPKASPAFTGSGSWDTPTFVIDATCHRVGIGTAAPDSWLQIGSGNGVGLRINYNNTCENYMDGAVHHFRNNSNVEYVTFNGTNICTTGCGLGVDWIATSDCRVKTNIQPIHNALSTVMKLQGVNYCLCNDCTCEIQLGLIAQDVQKVLPEVVSHSTPSEEDKKYCITDDKLGLKYDKLSAVLIEAIKEQQLQIKELDKKILCLCNDLNYYINLKYRD